jgi:hypothetical protein
MTPTALARPVPARLHADADADAISASLVHGVLRVCVPRAAAPAPLALALDVDETSAHARCGGAFAEEEAHDSAPLRVATLELPLPGGVAAADVALTLQPARREGEAATLRVALRGGDAATRAAAAGNALSAVGTQTRGQEPRHTELLLHHPLPRRAALAHVRASLGADGVLRLRVPLAPEAPPATTVRVTSSSSASSSSSGSDDEEDRRARRRPASIDELRSTSRHEEETFLSSLDAPRTPLHALLLLEAPAPGLRASDWSAELRGGSGGAHRTLVLVSASRPASAAQPTARCCQRHVVTLPPSVDAAALRVTVSGGVLRVRAPRAPPPRRTALRVDAWVHAELPEAEYE